MVRVLHESALFIIYSNVFIFVEQPPPPPINVMLRNLNRSRLVDLHFSWDPIPRSCPAIQYHINTTNCGLCPQNTTSLDVTCSVNVTAERRNCTFSVQTSLCNVKGMPSDILRVSLKGLCVDTIAACSFVA